jgi:hypothetical protein
MIYDQMTVEQSKEVLDELLGEFPFVDGRSKSVQVAAMLSLFGLNLLSRQAQVPMFVYTANAPRAGKTLLLKTVVIPVMGTAAVQTLSGEEEELRKVLDSVVREGSPYLALDNLKRRVNSPALEAFTTSATWSGRVLGQTGMFELAKQTVVLVTANHAQVSTDIAGRALFVDLWVAEADPQAREIRRVMEYLGVTVNRLIRVSYGPFQLGELEAGAVREVATASEATKPVAMNGEGFAA